MHVLYVWCCIQAIHTQVFRSRMNSSLLFLFHEAMKLTLMQFMSGYRILGISWDREVRNQKTPNPMPLRPSHRAPLGA